MAAIDIATLVDTFTSGIGPYWNITYGSPFTAGGWCLIPCAHASGIPQYAGIQSTTPGGANTWSVASSSTSVEVVVTPNGAGATNAYLRMAVSSPTTGTFVAITYDAVANTLTFGDYAGGVDAGAVTIPYIGSQHRWWRIRHGTGKVYWDTGIDGVTWTNRRVKAGAGAWMLSTVFLGFEASRNGGFDDYGAIDNVSTRGATATTAAAAGAGIVGIPSLSTGATQDTDTATGTGSVENPTLSAGSTVMADAASGSAGFPDVSIVTSASSIMSPPPTLFVRFPLTTFLFASPKAFSVDGTASVAGLYGRAVMYELSGSASIV